VTAAERVIRWSTVVAVAAVAVIAGWVSYRHAYGVVSSHGESGMIAHLYPGTIDGLMFAASMALLDAARRGVTAPALAQWLLSSRHQRNPVRHRPRRRRVWAARCRRRRLARAGPGRPL
jgi:hypothetical protein